MNEQERAVEELVSKYKLEAPRVTPQQVDDMIVGESYTVLPSGRSIVCELTLSNGWTVRGESSVVSKENFNEEVGRRVSRENARNEIWKYAGAWLCQRLYDTARSDIEAGFLWKGNGLDQFPIEQIGEEKKVRLQGAFRREDLIYLLARFDKE